MVKETRQVANAFIYQESRLLLQLRDDIPNIIYPNYWGLFGGNIEPGETPEGAIKRELEEEIGWVPSEIKYILRWKEVDEDWSVNIFAAALTVDMKSLKLTEGQDLGLFTLAEMTQMQVVPKIHKMLHKVVEAIAYPPLTAAWKALYNK